MSGRRLGAMLALGALVAVSIGVGVYAAAMVDLSKNASRFEQRAERADRPRLSSEMNLVEACERGQDNRASDLCAQWKAADSAHEAAWWAMAGTLVAMLGTLGLYWQIYLTRKAIEGTGDATSEMRKANQIAEDNSHRELRAYLGCKSVTIDQTEFDDDEFIINLEIVNHGQTPARVQKIVLQATWIFEGGSTVLIDFDAPNIFTCHRDTPMNLPCRFIGGFEGYGKDGHILVAGRLEYRDAFGKPQKESFGWRTAAEEFGPFYDTSFPIQLHAYSLEAVLSMIETRARAKS